MPLDVKAAVADALLELIRRKDADKITVKDLVEVCGISRQTFYYHFKDIVDVVEWAAQQGVQRLVRESLNAATPQEALGVFVDFAVESQPLVQRLLNSQRREAIERIMVDATRTYLADSLRERAGNARPPGRGLEDCPGFLCLWDDRTAAGELPPAGSGPAGAGGSAVPPAVRRDGPPSGNLTDVPGVSKSLTRGHFCQDRQPPLPVARTERTWYNHSMRAETAQ